MCGFYIKGSALMHILIESILGTLYIPLCVPYITYEEIVAITSLVCRTLSIIVLNNFNTVHSGPFQGPRKSAAIKKKSSLGLGAI